MMKYILPAFLLTFLAIVTPAAAVLPDEIMDNPVLEQRARAISRQLRCLVCQGEDIDESAAGLAHDLRLLVRERLLAGDSDAEVLAFIQARYGDYVLMKPPVKPATYLLWLTPLLTLLAGLALLLRRLRFKPAEGG